MGTTPPPHTPDQLGDAQGKGTLDQTGTSPRTHGPLEQESQVKIFHLYSVAKLCYVTLKHCQQPYFLNVGNHSAEKMEVQIDEEDK